MSTAPTQQLDNAADQPTIETPAETNPTYRERVPADLEHINTWFTTNIRTVYAIAGKALKAKGLPVTDDTVRELAHDIYVSAMRTCKFRPGIRPGSKAADTAIRKWTAKRMVNRAKDLYRTNHYGKDYNHVDRAYDQQTLGDLPDPAPDTSPELDELADRFAYVQQLILSQDPRYRLSPKEASVLSMKCALAAERDAAHRRGEQVGWGRGDDAEIARRIGLGSDKRVSALWQKVLTKLARFVAAIEDGKLCAETRHMFACSATVRDLCRHADPAELPDSLSPADALIVRHVLGPPRCLSCTRFMQRQRGYIDLMLAMHATALTVGAGVSLVAAKLLTDTTRRAASIKAAVATTAASIVVAGAVVVPTQLHRTPPPASAANTVVVASTPTADSLMRVRQTRLNAAAAAAARKKKAAARKKQVTQPPASVATPTPAPVAPRPSRPSSPTRSSSGGGSAPCGPACEFGP